MLGAMANVMRAVGLFFLLVGLLLLTGGIRGLQPLERKTRVGTVSRIDVHDTTKLGQILTVRFEGDPLHYNRTGLGAVEGLDERILQRVSVGDTVAIETVTWEPDLETLRADHNPLAILSLTKDGDVLLDDSWFGSALGTIVRWASPVAGLVALLGGLGIIALSFRVGRDEAA